MDDRLAQGALIRAMHRFGRANMGVCFSGAELTQGEFTCLSVIRADKGEEIEDAGVRVWKLAEGMCVQPPAVSRMLRSLEERGLIRRTIDREDRRNIRVSLTAEGEAAWERMARRVQGFAGRVIKRMGAEDMETLVALLNRLSDVIEQEAKEMREC